MKLQRAPPRWFMQHVASRLVLAPTLTTERMNLQLKGERRDLHYAGFTALTAKTKKAETKPKPRVKLLIGNGIHKKEATNERRMGK